MSDISNLTNKLKEYYENLSNENLSEAVKFMKTEPMKNIYNIFIDKIDNSEKISDEEINLLEMILRVANSIYNYSGEETGLTDSEYDVLCEYYREKANDDDFITEKLINKDDVVYHKFKSLRGTLDKIYKLTDEDEVKNKSQKSIDDWVNSCERRMRQNYKSTFNLYDCDVFVMPKYDGVSLILEFSKDGKLESALLRGDTTRNETKDVSHIVRNIVEAPITNSEYEYGLKTEVMMLNSDLEKYNQTYHTDYKNTRSIVSSILNSDEADERVNYLKIIPLRISYMIDGEESLQELAEGVYNYPYLKCKLKDLDKIRDFSFQHKTVAPGLRCDGSVIHIMNKDIQKFLGRENNKNKYEVAFKFTEEIGYSKVIDVEFTTGLFGSMNPVVRFKPIKLKGNTIEKASLGSFARFNDLGLAKGDIIKISYDIIPYIFFDYNDSNCVKSGELPIEPPLVCGECGTPFEENKDGTSYFCPNKKCPCRLRGKILNYCSKMNIDNISFATITDFYNHGYLNSIEDLYDLENHRNSLCQLPGYKEKKINNIINSINTKRDTIPSELFGSIGIESVSTKTFKNVFDLFNIDDVIDLAKDNNIIGFTVCKGIKEKTATKIVEGIRENLKLIDFLRNRLNVMPEPYSENLFSVVFSKVRDSQKEQYIIENGGTVSDSVSKNTTFVVVPNYSVTSNKIEKAKELGIPIILVEDVESFVDDLDI